MQIKIFDLIDIYLVVFNQKIKIKHEVPNQKTTNLKQPICSCNMDLRLVYKPILCMNKPNKLIINTHVLTCIAQAKQKLK
jgi:hypothetical protein